MRARDHGIAIGAGTPGPLNAITDVAGVRVGHTHADRGRRAAAVGHGPVRTGVTVIFRPDRSGSNRMFAGCHRLNGNGEMTGLEWVRESGLLTIADRAHEHPQRRRRPRRADRGGARDRSGDELLSGRCRWWPRPGTGSLNDVNGFHVRPEHVHEALAAARDGAVAEGAVGGGTGMICHGFKGGIGTASRVLSESEGGHTVGVLVQANHGRRERFAVNGVPVGRAIDDIAAAGGAGRRPTRAPARSS